VFGGRLLAAATRAATAASTVSDHVITSLGCLTSLLAWQITRTGDCRPLSISGVIFSLVTPVW
jgi:hypothetical protein